MATRTRRKTTRQSRWAKAMRQAGGNAKKASGLYRKKNPWVKGYKRRKVKSAAARKRYPGKVTKRQVVKAQPHWRSKSMLRYRRGKKKGQFRTASKRIQRRPSRMPRRIAATRWAANPMTMNPMMMNPRGIRRRRKTAIRGRRRSYRRNPGFAGVFAPVREVFMPQTLITAAWGAGGAFGALALPGLIGQVLPGGLKTQYERVNRGIGAVALTAVSAGLVTGLAGLLPMTRKRQSEIMAGGMIATIIRAGAEFLPAFFPLAIAAKPIALPGTAAAAPAAGTAGMYDYSTGYFAGEGVGAWETGMNDYDTGMEDYDTGMEAYADMDMDMVNAPL